MKYYEERITQLFAFDKIRLGKILEMGQFAVVFTVIAVLGASLMNKYVLGPVDNTSLMMPLLLKVALELWLATVMLFYMRKVVLIVPSLAAILIPNFRPYTTIDVGIWMIMAVVFIWGMPKLEEKVRMLFKQVDDLYHSNE